MTETEGKARGRGRPPLAESEKKRHTLAFRLTSNVRDALQNRAEFYGRSLSEEVEWVISTSVFADIPMLNHMAGTEHDDLENKYNQIIDNINNCNIIQNAMTKLFMTIVEVDRINKSEEIHKYIDVLTQMTQMVRSHVQSIEWDAVEDRNNIMLKIYDKIRPNSEENKSVDGEEIKRLFTGREIHLRDYMTAVLKDLGISTASSDEIKNRKL